VCHTAERWRALPANAEQIIIYLNYLYFPFFIEEPRRNDGKAAHDHRSWIDSFSSNFIAASQGFDAGFEQGCPHLQ